MLEKRKNQRIRLEGLHADVSDGKAIYRGEVKDISRTGISVINLPPEMDTKTDLVTAVVSGKGENFKMFLTPRWNTAAGNYTSVGLEIENSSWSWNEFVVQFESKEECLPSFNNTIQRERFPLKCVSGPFQQRKFDQ